MFNPASSQGYQAVTDNIRMKTIVYGAKTLMTEFRLKAGADLPAHQHPHEQTGYLVAGRIDQAGLAGVLGTVAGDDTIFIAVDESTEAAAVAAEIEGG